MFYKFQREFQNAIFNCGVYKVQIEEAVEEFEVADNTRKKTYHVTFIPDSHDCFCSCKMFESMGILCRHVLFVIKGKFLTEIPEQHILHRWTKDASKKPIFDFCEDFDDHLELLLERLSAFEEEMKPGKENVEQQSKDKHIELFVGSNIVSGGILPPNKSSNKGSGTGKRKKVIKR
ncbi:protein FAR1-RELATED SEQUENCE 1-like [Beta vulgaris subsp. vulgaris]|uniref:protein FAR1-RELATED SEQUENCE 1-like n=1 Tax=Beta vulgaris subsp. vulgaris TaxID=3555 RepID=UPI002547226A|nr:protein FAR1-RELATED SEQUENCE 1-like [Beta vulgaris subsp. vulgaris]